MAKAGFAWCFGAFLGLAALAFASGTLDLLTVIFIAGAVVSLLLCAIFGLILVAGWAWGNFHAVEVIPGEWYFRHWPHQQVAEPSGIAVRVRESAGTVKVTCRARLDQGEVVFTTTIPAGSDGVYGAGFSQQKVRFGSEPNEGDPIQLIVSAHPSWWRGRSSERAQTVLCGITDHRPAPFAVTPQQIRDALTRLDPLIREAQAILDCCGRPAEKMEGADPMYFQNECMPRINQFATDSAALINEVVPEYIGKFENVGNVTHNTDTKPAMIQQVEKWLENLGAIQDDLRNRLTNPETQEATAKS